MTKPIEMNSCFPSPEMIEAIDRVNATITIDSTIETERHVRIRELIHNSIRKPVDNPTPHNFIKFLESKPKELRLGQYFFNKYLHRLKPEDRMHHETQLLYNTTDTLLAIKLIAEIATNYQWKDLPE